MESSSIYLYAPSTSLPTSLKTMASKLFPSSFHKALTFLYVTLFLFLFLTPSLSDIPPSAPVPPGTACDAAPDPTFCKFILQPRGSANLLDYTRFSLAKSLTNAYYFSNIVNRYLSLRTSLPESAVRALEDCKLLSELNIDFLASAGTTCNTSSSLLDPQADGVQTVLSALLTNHQTCLNGLEEAAADGSVKNGLSLPLSNGSKLYSVSLALFNRGWVPKRGGRFHSGFTPARIPDIKKWKVPRGRSLLFHEAEIGEGGSLPLRLSKEDRDIFESRNGRKLLQTSNQVNVNQTVVVSKNGDGNFTTINDAVSAAPNNSKASNGYFLILVHEGVYEEYVSIPKNKKYIMMIGDGINKTVVTGSHNVVDGWTTFNSATFAVVGEGFVAVNMTFQNTAGPSKHQAVAVRSGADLSAFYTCSFEGYQDTLYHHSLRQFYRECDIYGTVDYMFGNAAVVFQNCNIYSRLPMQNQKNTVTAQGRTDPNQNTGTSIQNCNFLAAPDLASGGGSIQSYLGRPWKQYSRTVIIQSFIDSLIDPAGWLPWDGDFALSTLYYAEYNNRGPGSATGGRVTWPGYHVIGATDAANFTASSFILGDNWLPQRGVPYQSGL